MENLLISDYISIFDQTGDGLISKDSLFKIARLSGILSSEEDLEAFHTKENYSQHLSDEQTKDFIEKYQSHLTNADVETAFKIFDRDCTGKIKMAEFKQLLNSKTEKLSAEEIDAVMGNVVKDDAGDVLYKMFLDK
eukprot:GAHX01000653.1.p1 GENE.GAHX01000653.1~~GAHX01000653.1.p1  ORF type:complete len:136 (+),score=37.09 GAHX01000653.1:42-449(+)